MKPAARARLLVDRLTARRLKGKVVAVVVHPETRQAYPTTYEYGVRDSGYATGYHTGEDHACPTGSLALAPSWGTVQYAGPGGARWGSSYGNQVIVRTKDGRYDYAHNHLSEVLVKAGDVVVPGTLLGLVGSTGNSTGPHTHFEARPAGGRYGSDVHPVRVKKMVTSR